MGICTLVLPAPRRWERELTPDESPQWHVGEKAHSERTAAERVCAWVVRPMVRWRATDEVGVRWGCVMGECVLVNADRRRVQR